MEEYPFNGFDKLSDEQARRENARRSREFALAMGINPDVQSHEFFGCFTFGEAQSSLFKSIRTVPVPVFLTGETDDTSEKVRLPVVLDVARSIWPSAATASVSSVDQDWHRGAHPDWYFEGWVLKLSHDPYRRHARVRIVVVCCRQHEFIEHDSFIWQYIPEGEVMPER